MPAHSPWTYSAKCQHAGTTPLFTVEGRTFYAVNSEGIRTTPVADCVIDLGGITTRLTTAGRPFVDLDDSTWAGAPALAAAFAPAPTLGPILRLDWPDYGTPPDNIGVQFWRTLLAGLPQGRIVVGCIGSHGRTGTCLAALRIVHCGDSAPNAVNWVRRHHCVNAVESKAQLTYLWQLAKTVGTVDQPYDQALADAVTALVPAPTPKPQAPTPKPGPTVTSTLESVTYHHRTQGRTEVPAAQWLDHSYYSSTFRPHAVTESRLLRFV